MRTTKAGSRGVEGFNVKMFARIRQLNILTPHINVSSSQKAMEDQRLTKEKADICSLLVDKEESAVLSELFSTAKTV